MDYSETKGGLRSLVQAIDSLWQFIWSGLAFVVDKVSTAVSRILKTHVKRRAMFFSMRRMLTT
jgi:hypothetical protein